MKHGNGKTQMLQGRGGLAPHMQACKPRGCKGEGTGTESGPFVHRPPPPARRQSEYNGAVE